VGRNVDALEQEVEVEQAVALLLLVLDGYWLGFSGWRCGLLEEAGQDALLLLCQLTCDATQQQAHSSERNEEIRRRR
jgi:hypothetical protein